MAFVFTPPKTVNAVTSSTSDKFKRRPSMVDSLFDVEPRKAPLFSLRRLKQFVGKKTKTCSVAFKQNELIFTRNKDFGKPIYVCDLRTTLMRIIHKNQGNRKHETRTEMEITAGGETHRIFAGSPEAAEKLLSAVRVEKQYVLKDDPVKKTHGTVKKIHATVRKNHGKGLVEMLRINDVSNRMCADCRGPQPAWVSYHKHDGAVSLLCGACAGYHRKRGTRNVFIQSLRLDSKAWQSGVKDARSDLQSALPSPSKAKVNRILSVGVLKRRASLMESNPGETKYIYEKYANRRGRLLGKLGGN